MTISPCANANAVAHSQAASNTKPNIAPSSAARDYLAANPEADDKPFGKLVSMFAKGKTPSSA